MELPDHWHAITDRSRTVPLLKYANDKHVKKSALITCYTIELFFKQVSPKPKPTLLRRWIAVFIKNELRPHHILSFVSSHMHTRYLKRKLSSSSHVLGLETTIQRFDKVL